MKKRSNQVALSSITLISLITIIIIGFLNYYFSDHFPKESDFLRPWSALRSYIDFGTDPYSNKVTNKAQSFYYDGLAGSDSNPLILDQALSAVILYFPLTVIKDYKFARILYITILELALIGIPFLCISLYKWKPSWLITLLFALSITVSPYSIQTIKSHDPIVIVIMFVLIGLICLNQGLDEFAGAAFAIAIFQPSVTGLLLIFILYWIIRKKRWRVIWGWLMMFGLLLVISIALVPGWIPEFIKAFRVQSTFKGYLTTNSILSGLSPIMGGKLATLIRTFSIILIIYEWIIMNINDNRWFFWTVSLTICSFSLIGLPVLNNSVMIMIIPLAYLIMALTKRFDNGKKPIISATVIFVISLINWLAYYLLIKNNQVEKMNFLLFILFPIVLIIGLYSIRWWSIKYPKSRLISRE